MIDKSRAKKGIKCRDLIIQIRANDLIAIERGRKKVHIVFSDSISICRQALMDTSKLRRGNRRWEIIGALQRSDDFQTAVLNDNRVPCEHCIKWYR